MIQILLVRGKNQHCSTHTLAPSHQMANVPGLLVPIFQAASTALVRMLSTVPYSTSPILTLEVAQPLATMTSVKSSQATLVKDRKETAHRSLFRAKKRF